MPSARVTGTAHLKRYHGKAQAQVIPVAPWSLPGLRGPLAACVLLFTTILTTTLIGMRYMHAFRRGDSPLATFDDILPYRWDLSHLHLIAGGLPFSLTLVCILLAYRAAQFYVCRYFKVLADLPLFLPAPAFSGTLGAFSRIRSRVGTRTAFMTIGVAGPAAAFAVAFATTCYGLIHSSPMAAGAAPSLIHISAPLLFKLLRQTLLASYPDIPPLLTMSPHPILLASWIGLLITACNLIPAGQLDGGRIVYALSPRLHRMTSTLSLGLLIYLGTFEWAGWLLGVAAILWTGLKHPKTTDQADVSLEYLALVPIAVAIFIVSTSTQPITGMSLVQVFLRIHWGL